MYFFQSVTHAYGRSTFAIFFGNSFVIAMTRITWTVVTFNQSKLAVQFFVNIGEQGCRSGESTGLQSMWPGFDSRSWLHMWVKFVACWFSPLFRGFYLLVLRFNSLHKKQYFTFERVPSELLGALWVNRLHLHLPQQTNYISFSPWRFFLLTWVWAQISSFLPFFVFVFVLFLFFSFRTNAVSSKKCCILTSHVSC